ncbi:MULTISPECIES: SAUGI family uracil-DNA glycosylase inhibitor [Staphylococcus]
MKDALFSFTYYSETLYQRSIYPFIIYYQKNS